MLPFENETRFQEYQPPLGTYQVRRLNWKHIPQKANGVYQCYDALNDKIPVSNISVNVLGIILPFKYLLLYI